MDDRVVDVQIITVDKTTVDGRLEILLSIRNDLLSARNIAGPDGIVDKAEAQSAVRINELLAPLGVSPRYRLNKLAAIQESWGAIHRPAQPEKIILDLRGMSHEERQRIERSFDFDQSNPAHLSYFGYEIGGWEINFDSIGLQNVDDLMNGTGMRFITRLSDIQYKEHQMQRNFGLLLRDIALNGDQNSNKYSKPEVFFDGGYLALARQIIAKYQATN